MPFFGYGDAMTKLSPKSRRFIAAVIEEAGNPRAQEIWGALDKNTPQDIPPAAEHAALIALSEYERQLLAALRRPGLDEDEAADLSNDVATVRAIVRTLRPEYVPQDRKLGRPCMDIRGARQAIERSWDDEIVPALIEYIRIPNKSPAFDPDWAAHGHMEAAIAL
ncbi:MAG: hypothetical protein ACREFA_01440, partial [Stellaceae bacterium]